MQFSSVDPTGRYRLDMRTPYSQMIARRLYDLASTRMGCSFAKWSSPPSPRLMKRKKRKRKKKKRTMAKGREFTFKRARQVKRGATGVKRREADSQALVRRVMSLYAAVRSRKKDLQDISGMFGMGLILMLIVCLS